MTHTRHMMNLMQTVTLLRVLTGFFVVLGVVSAVLGIINTSTGGYIAAFVLLILAAASLKGAQQRQQP